jgi:hypothetical protein
MQFVYTEQLLSPKLSQPKFQIMHLVILANSTKCLDTNMYMSDHTSTPLFEVLSSHT